MRAHADEIASYTLRATLDPALHTVHGTGTLRWTNASTRGVSELWFHLYLNAFKNQSSVFLRTPIGGFRGSTVPKEWGTIDVRKLVWIDGGERRDLLPSLETRRPGDEDETDARAPLPREIAPGETVTLEMEWDDKLPSVVERTGFDGSFHMVAQWFPKIAKIEPDGTFAHFPFHHLGEFYADYGTYDVTLDVPEAFTVGATGRAVETKLEGSRRIQRHVQSDVHDFAWTAFDRFQELDEKVGSVDVKVLHPPGYGDVARRELEAIRFALPHFGDQYGAYPYDVLTVVHPPQRAGEAGGMEYPTLITTGGHPWTPRGVRSPELVTIHEFGHQYFYGLLGSHETKWPFLDEGLNTYAEARATTAWKGAAGMVDLLGLKAGAAENYASWSRGSAADERIAQPAYGFQTGSAYGRLVYARTGTILETLRRVYGDEAVTRTLGVYARRHRFTHPTPDDLLEAFRTEMGPEVAETLRTALFDKGWVDFTVVAASSHASRPAGGIFDEGGKRETRPSGKTKSDEFDGWVVVSRRGTLRFPTEVELLLEDGTRTRLPWDAAADNARLPFSGRSPIRSVVVDPDRRVLLDADPTNNFMTAPGQKPAGAKRTLERALFWLEALGSGVVP